LNMSSDVQPSRCDAAPPSADATERSVSNSATPEHRISASRHFPSYLRFGGVAVLGLALDLWSKHWAFHTLGQGHRPMVVIRHALGIGGGQTLLFLVASAFALLLVVWMFAQTSARRWGLQIALGGILAGALGNMYDRIFVKLIETPWPQAGAYVTRTEDTGDGVVLQVYPPKEGAREFVVSRDRVPREVGFVRDFLKIPTTLPDWRWIPAKLRNRELWPWVFNVADALLVGGVIILAIHLWRDRKHPPRRKRRAVDSPASSA
jgi:signal peptidase II